MNALQHIQENITFINSFIEESNFKNFKDFGTADRNHRYVKVDIGKAIEFLKDFKIRDIINTWGNKPGNPEDYIFPILNGRKTAVDKENRRNKIQRQINDNLKAIGIKLGIEEKIILAVSRHSFATHLKISGTPTSFISDAMGHSSSRTTENYLKSITLDKARELSHTLLNFNEPRP